MTIGSSSSLVTKRVTPASLQALTSALSRAFWYKKDMRAFLHASIGDRALVAQLDWDASKRQIASQLVDSLAADQRRHLNTILKLMFDLGDITDPSYLKELDDGEIKYEAAVQALNALRMQTERFRSLQTEEEIAARRRQMERARLEQKRVMAAELEKLEEQFCDMTKLDPQTRGYGLERFLNELFMLFDIDARAPFKNLGEQIDGAFTLENTEFILEAKWQQGLTPPIDLDIFSRKVGRKLENTLGLFLSINGFAANSIDLHSRGQRPSIILMTGEDLVAVLEGRIPLTNLITRKRQHAARTGEILLTASGFLL